MVSLPEDCVNKSEFKEDVMFYKTKFLNDFKKIDAKYDYFYRPYEQGSKEDQEYFEIELAGQR